MKEMYVVKGLVKAPFTITRENIQKLKPWDGEKLYEIIGEISTIKDEKKSD